MKIQMDEGIVEVIALQKGQDVRLSVAGLDNVVGSVVLSPREIKVVIAALDAATDTTL